jgi:hypothetical protein
LIENTEVLQEILGRSCFMACSSRMRSCLLFRQLCGTRILLVSCVLKQSLLMAAVSSSVLHCFAHTIAHSHTCISLQSPQRR